MKPKNELCLTVEEPGIGTVHLVRNRRAKRISIRIRADGEIRVTVPGRASFDQARNFVAGKREWIIRHLAAAREKKRLALNLAAAAAGSGLDPETAKTRILTRLEQLAENFGFTYNRVTIRTQKTRWGSCSANNNLSLNLKLALLDNELLDLVLVHELVHTEIKNHGPEFKRRLAKLVPGADRLDQKLKAYSGLLRIPLATRPPDPPTTGKRPESREKF